MAARKRNTPSPGAQGRTVWKAMRAKKRFTVKQAAKATGLSEVKARTGIDWLRRYGYVQPMGESYTPSRSSFRVNPDKHPPASWKFKEAPGLARPKKKSRKKPSRIIHQDTGQGKMVGFIDYDEGKYYPIGDIEEIDPGDPLANPRSAGSQGQVSSPGDRRGKPKYEVVYLVYSGTARWAVKPSDWTVTRVKVDTDKISPEAALKKYWNRIAPGATYFTIRKMSEAGEQGPILARLEKDEYGGGAKIVSAFNGDTEKALCQYYGRKVAAPRRPYPKARRNPKKTSKRTRKYGSARKRHNLTEGQIEEQNEKSWGAIPIDSDRWPNTRLSSALERQNAMWIYHLRGDYNRSYVIEVYNPTGSSKWYVSAFERNPWFKFWRNPDSAPGPYLMRGWEGSRRQLQRGFDKVVYDLANFGPDRELAAMGTDHQRVKPIRRRPSANPKKKAPANNWIRVRRRISRGHILNLWRGPILSKSGSLKGDDFASSGDYYWEIQYDEGADLWELYRTSSKPVASSGTRRTFSEKEDEYLHIYGPWYSARKGRFSSFKEAEGKVPKKDAKHWITASRAKVKRKTTKKKVTRKKTPPYQLLINRCQKLWTHYCERPSKKRLEALYVHLEKMKASTSKKVATERSRCLRGANAEAKKLKYKRK